MPFWSVEVKDSITKEGKVQCKSAIKIDLSKCPKIQENVNMVKGHSSQE
jgi:hypothetical protein